MIQCILRAMPIAACRTASLALSVGCALGQHHQSWIAMTQGIVLKPEIILFKQIVKIVNLYMCQHNFF